MQIIWYDTVDSTNAEVLRRAAELEHLTVIAARSQTAGRGQRGNTWTSAPGENMTFTILVKWDGQPEAEALVRLNMAAAISVRNFLRAEDVDAVIKWPNDIYVGRRKICGMLIENKLVPDGTVSAVGIGINLNQTVFPASLLNPTSVKLLTGRETDSEKALERFMTDFSTSLRSAAAQTPLGYDLCDDYCSALFQKDVARPYRDLRTGEVFTGIIRGVSPADGRLMVERSDGGGPTLGPLPAKKAQNDGGGPNPGPPPAPEMDFYSFKEIGYIL